MHFKMHESSKIRSIISLEANKEKFRPSTFHIRLESWKKELKIDSDGH
jgi:hypothetical protein